MVRPRIDKLARQRIVADLAARLQAKITLDTLQVSLGAGEVHATNLVAVPLALENKSQAGQPLPPILRIAELRAETSFFDAIFRGGSHSRRFARGVEIDLTAEEARRMFASPHPDRPPGYGAVSLEATDVTLHLPPAERGQAARVVHCSHVRLDHLDRMQIDFAIDVTAPVPYLHLAGSVAPRDLSALAATALQGSYVLGRTQLSTIPGATGVRGSIAAKGTFAGTLGELTVAGEAQSPDFALDVSAHPFAASASYRAVLGLGSDRVALPALSAHFLQTTATGSGAMESDAGESTRATLDVHIRDGRNEDLLTLLDGSRPNLLGRIKLDTRLEVVPGTGSLMSRTSAAGSGTIAGLHWANPTVQREMDTLAMRASGKSDAAEDHPGSIPFAAASISGSFRLRNARLAFTHLVYTLPGAVILMEGGFPLAGPEKTGGEIGFHGVARTVASVSEMHTGLKSVLLKPFDGLLRKPGTGMQIPVTFAGSKFSPVLSVDLAHTRRDKVVLERGAKTPRLHP